MQEFQCFQAPARAPVVLEKTAQHRANLPAFGGLWRNRFFPIGADVLQARQKAEAVSGDAVPSAEGIPVSLSGLRLAENRSGPVAAILGPRFGAVTVAAEGRRPVRR